MHNDPISIQVFFLVVYSFFYKFSIYCMSMKIKLSLTEINLIQINYLDLFYYIF